MPAVKSLLVRARVGLVEAGEARDADCGEIRADLLRSYDRGVKASGRARRHMRSCHGCREYRVALRGMRRSFAALTPAGLGPLALVAKLVGFGGAGSGAAGSGSGAAAGGGAAITGGALGGGGVIAGSGLAGSGAAVGGTLATATACKVAAVVCATALAGGAVEVKREIVHHHARPARAAAHATAAPAMTPVTAAVRHVFAAPLVVHRMAATTPAKAAHHAKPAKPAATPAASPAATPTATEITAPDRRRGRSGRLAGGHRHARRHPHRPARRLADLRDAAGRRAARGRRQRADRPRGGHRRGRLRPPPSAGQPTG